MHRPLLFCAVLILSAGAAWGQSPPAPDQTEQIRILLERVQQLEKRVSELLKAGTGETGTVQRIGDLELHLSESSVDDRDQITAIMDGFRAKHKRAISVLFTTGERAGIHVAVTDDLVSKGVKAGEIANAIASTTGGKGGGRPHFASAGVGDVTKLGEARARTPEIVRDLAR